MSLPRGSLDFLLLHTALSHGSLVRSIVLQHDVVGARGYCRVGLFFLFARGFAIAPGGFSLRSYTSQISITRSRVVTFEG
jgi:hypothetical protein